MKKKKKHWNKIPNAISNYCYFTFRGNYLVNLTRDKTLENDFYFIGEFKKSREKVMLSSYWARI